MPSDGHAAAYRAFFAAIEESGRDFLVVGDFAANFHLADKRPVETLEVWLGPRKPGQGPAEELWANYFKHLGHYSEKADALVDKFNVLTEVPGLMFEAAHEHGKQTEFFGRMVPIATSDAVAEIKRAMARTPEQVKAAEELQRKFQEAARLAQQPRPEDPDDPGPRPKPYLVKPKL